MSIRTWSMDEEQELRVLYLEENLRDVHELARHFGKGYRSVISKLVQLKIYKKPIELDEDRGLTVKVMLRELENVLSIQIEGTNLSKKENLVKIVKALRVKLPQTD